MTAAELIQNYAEVRQRLMGRPAHRQVFMKAPPPSPPMQQKPEPHKHMGYERDWLDVSVKPNLQIRSSRFIIEMTAKKYAVSVAELKGERREKNMVRARHECFYRLSKELGYSLPKIGKIVGGRDHSTVHNGIKRHEMRMIDPGIDDRPTRGRTT